MEIKFKCARGDITTLKKMMWCTSWETLDEEGSLLLDFTFY